MVLEKPNPFLSATGWLNVQTICFNTEEQLHVFPSTTRVTNHRHVTAERHHSLPGKDRAATSGPEITFIYAMD